MLNLALAFVWLIVGIGFYSWRSYQIDQGVPPENAPSIYIVYGSMLLFAYNMVRFLVAFNRLLKRISSADIDTQQRAGPPPKVVDPEFDLLLKKSK